MYVIGRGQLATFYTANIVGPHSMKSLLSYNVRRFDRRTFSRIVVVYTEIGR